jgi:uncharacterized YigZ family protein
MTQKRIIPADEREIEHFVSNSRFIASLKPTFTVEEAKEYINKIKDKYSDASHHVPAYIIGHPPSVVEHCSDDGEPAGTAGKPALAVLRGSGFGDISIVVTRYFGGTKLGTGGLVRAYSDSVRFVLENLPKAKKVETAITKFQLPYNLYDQTQQIIHKFNGQIVTQDFTSEVTLELQFMTSDFEGFSKAILELTRGQISPQIVSTNQNSIFPINDNSSKF